VQPDHLLGRAAFAAISPIGNDDVEAKMVCGRNAAQRLHHLLLKRQIFKYGFNHQIAVRKTAVIRRTGDRRQGFITLACLDMAAFDL
jgi:hypothetical protein